MQEVTDDEYDDLERYRLALEWIAKMPVHIPEEVCSKLGVHINPSPYEIARAALANAES